MEHVLTGAILTRLFVFLIYVLAALISFRWLIPRQSSIAKRLATGLLAAQVVLVMIALVYQPSSDFQNWLWDLRWEWNIPAVFSATQLTMVAAFALFSAWLSRAGSYWKRLYLVSLSLLFVILILDEYFAFEHTVWAMQLAPLRLDYTGLGAVFAAATLFVATRESKLLRIWQFTLLGGLALMAMGGIVLDKLPAICGSLGILRIDGCINTSIVEECLELLGVWLAVVAVLGQFSNVAPEPLRFERLLHFSPVIIFSLLLLFSVAFSYGFDELRRLPLRLSVRRAMSNLAQPVSIQFEPDVHLQGYIIDSEKKSTAGRLFSSAGLSPTTELIYSVHLVDQANGNSIASKNMKWCCPSSLNVYGPICERKCLTQRIYPGWLLDEPVFSQRIVVSIPPDAPRNRALWIVLALLREQNGEFVPQKVVSSDLHLLSDEQVLLDEIVLQADSPASSLLPLASFEAGFKLETASIPERGHPGDPLPVTFAWRSDVDSRLNLIQFLHLGHTESGEWFVYDQQPLGARLPTRLWYSGLADSETWQVPLPPDMAPGRYEVFTGLYRVTDLERMIARDPSGEPFLDARVPLGSMNVTNEG